MSRELDALVAEKVMGWQWYVDLDDVASKIHGYRYLHKGVPHWSRKASGNEPIWHDHIYGLPEFTTDPAADYEVLKHVRERWSLQDKTVFEDALSTLFADKFRRDRTGSIVSWNTSCLYEPGDYSMAALKALGLDTPNPAAE